MGAVIERSKTRTHKWGWGILLVVSALLVLTAIALVGQLLARRGLA